MKSFLPRLMAACFGIFFAFSSLASAGPISLCAREDGSGTRGAFVELFDLIEKVNGKKQDMTSDKAEITNSTAVMLSTVSGNKNAIGYSSLGALNDSVKALAVDGAKPSRENIKNGSYKIARPFNLALSAKAGEPARAFLEYILSAPGQAVVEKAGYVSQGAEAPKGKFNPAGKVVVAGSSSVTPVMEKLKEAYLKLNPGTVIEIQMSDSTTGMSAARDGICDIGMASRDLKESELKAGLKPQVMATDGIAIVVNKANPLENISKAQVRDVYTGKVRDWRELGAK